MCMWEKNIRVVCCTTAARVSRLRIRYEVKPALSNRAYVCIFVRHFFFFSRFLSVSLSLPFKFSYENILPFFHHTLAYVNGTHTALCVNCLYSYIMLLPSIARTFSFSVVFFQLITIIWLTTVWLGKMCSEFFRIYVVREKKTSANERNRQAYTSTLTAVQPTVKETET